MAGTLAGGRTADVGSGFSSHRHCAGSRHPGRGFGPCAGHVRQSALGPGQGATRTDWRRGSARCPGRRDHGPRRESRHRTGSPRGGFWAAGVAASPLVCSLNIALDRAGRVSVEPDLTVPGHPNIYVIGDLARLEQDGKLVPGIAPAAMQEGRHAAINVMRTLLVSHACRFVTFRRRWPPLAVVPLSPTSGKSWRFRDTSPGCSGCLFIFFS